MDRKLPKDKMIFKVAFISQNSMILVIDFVTCDDSILVI